MYECEASAARAANARIAGNGLEPMRRIPLSCKMQRKNEGDARTWVGERGGTISIVRTLKKPGRRHGDHRRLFYARIVTGGGTVVVKIDDDQHEFDRHHRSPLYLRQLC